MHSQVIINLIFFLSQLNLNTLSVLLIKHEYLNVKCQFKRSIKYFNTCPLLKLRDFATFEIVSL